MDIITISVEKLKAILSENRELIQKDIEKAINTVNNKDDRMTVKDVAEFLSLKEPTIYNKVYANLIPHSRIGRKLIFSRKELQDWIDKGCPSPAREKANNFFIKESLEGDINEPTHKANKN